VSVGPNPPQVDLNLIEQTRKQINRLVEEIARLSEQDLAPAEYYGEFLQRVLTALAAPAGAIWVRTPQGHLQLQYQINLRQVGLDRSEAERQGHDELLRQAAQMGRPLLLPPRSSTGTQEEGRPTPGNPTDYMILLAPILVEKQVAGLIEIWQDADRNPDAQRGFLNFLVRMAELASSYSRNHQLRHITGQQQLWTQLEAFARQIHSSLNPVEVGYLVANEGRRLVDCDRVSVAQRRGSKTHVEAISGADVVEKRSNLVRLMATLFDKVMVWGERLVYRGVKDDSLPPAVLNALDAYLAESNSKLLVILPLRDDRESDSKKPPRSGIMMECFDPSATPEQLIARLEVVGKHATSALYNAAEHRRIPMRFLWQPIAKVQDGLGGKARAITTAVVVGLALLTLAMILVPYPLKMDANGQLLPRERRWVFSPVEGRVEEIRAEPGQDVNAGDQLVLMRDLQLEFQLRGLREEIAGHDREIQSFGQQYSQARPEERVQISHDIVKAETTKRMKEQQLESLIENTNSDSSRLGRFWLLAPVTGTILNSDFKETLTNRQVKPNEPLLRVGNKGSGTSDWEIELKIPQKHIGQVLKSFDYVGKEEVDVDVIVLSAPTRTFTGKLARTNIGGEATPNRDDNNESEPVVYAWVRIHGDDIPADERLPLDLLVTGTEVRAKVRCGNHAMGYSLFYGVWEFFYEKVVFFF
jgi:hypothetical protein